MNRRDLSLTGNAILILILCGVLFGGFFVQFFKHEQPCPLCLLQRLGMIGVAIGAALNLRFGIDPKHYAFSLLSCLVGSSVALRQITLHVCPNFPVSEVAPVLGLSLYTWSFIVFFCSVLSIALLLFLYDIRHQEKVPMNWLAKTALIALFLLIAGNVITTYLICGLGPCAD